MRKAATVAVALAMTVFGGATAGAARDSASVRLYDLSAAMNTKQVVTPENKPWQGPARLVKATGTFTGAFDRAKNRLTWRLTYSGIGKQPLVIADVHLGRPGTFGAIIVRLCAPCRTGQKGVRTVKPSFAGAITGGNSWVTVITGEYPNGVIRGQIRARAR